MGKAKSQVIVPNSNSSDRLGRDRFACPRNQNAKNCNDSESRSCRPNCALTPPRAGEGFLRPGAVRSTMRLGMMTNRSAAVRRFRKLT